MRSMRRILASAMLALTLAGGIMSFIAASVEARPGPKTHCEGNAVGDMC